MAVAFQNDGKIIIGGYFSIVNGVARNNIARLNADGSLDRSWNPSANNAVRQIILNGTDVFILGDFYGIGGESRSGLAKLSTDGDGTPDPLWNPEHPDNIHAIALSGTDLFVGGLNYLAKLSTLGTGAGQSLWGPQPDYNINSLLVHGTDIYVAGNFTKLGDLDRNRVAKISSTGEVDPTWDPGAIGGNLGYIPVLLPSQDYLYVGGSFDQIGGQNRLNLARLSFTGTFVGSREADPFWFPSVAHEITYALAMNATDVYVGGDLSRTVGDPRRYLARLSVAQPGSTDLSWAPNPDGLVTTLVLRDGTLFVGGAFTSINDVYSPSFAKLTASTGALDSSFKAQVGYLDSASSLLEFAPAKGLTLYGIPGGTYQIEISDEVSANWQALTTVTLSSESTVIAGTRLVAAGKRFYRARLIP